MTDPATATAPPTAARWLLLIHQLPPKPDYLRVKIRRRLQRLGALLVKNSVYALPNTAEAREDLSWLEAEIAAEGGEAIICEASFVAGTTDEEIEGEFRAQSTAALQELATEVEAMLAGGASRGAPGVDAEEPEGSLSPARIRRRLQEIKRTDFFDAVDASRVDALLHAGEQRGAPASARRARSASTVARPQGATWVTRRDVFVDRIASAWLIRRYIYPAAKFKFVSGATHRAAAGELVFDMARGHFTHEGDRCTFEVLCARFGLGDPALVKIGEIVHDIDLKDAKYGHPEAAGVSAILAGLVRGEPDDGRRIEKGAALFDALAGEARPPLPTEPGGDAKVRVRIAPVRGK